MGTKPVALDPLIWRTGCLLTCVHYGIATALEILNEGRYSKYQGGKGANIILFCILNFVCKNLNFSNFEYENYLGVIMID